MKFLAIIYNDESMYATATPEQIGAIFAPHGKFGEDSRAAGVFAGGEGLEPSSAATTVRVRDGERLLTDGPYAETKEQLGGYFIVEAKDLDEAIRWGQKCPGAHHGSVEVRPLMPKPGA